jgi:hypothetical protein
MLVPQPREVDMDNLEVLTDLSTREMQALGALCLHRFCKAKGIEHSYIEDLNQHLLSLLVASSLNDWERKGAALELSGRGDPIPDALATQLADDVRKDFARLVYFAVEIGFVDMYGDTTRRPLHNLLRCLAILDAHGIEHPQVPELFKDRTPTGRTAPDWGELLSPEQYEQVRTVFR